MRTIGKYEIRGRLGRGGMGVVYKARQPVTGRMVALKLCRPAEMVEELLGLEAIRADFWAEARAMSRVRHPLVAQVLDIGTADDGDCCPPGTPYFVMEYLCSDLGALIGETFDAETPTRRLSTDQALDLAGQMLQALARMHFSGLVHRDIKPHNVMLTDDGPRSGSGPGSGSGREVRLIDFGLSKLRGDEHAEKPGQRPKGLVAGSPYYAAPEQEADPHAGDARSDLYSVGITLFRMLTGELPEKEKHASRLNPELDERFDQFLLQAMAPDPADRFQSAREMLEALHGLREHWRSIKAEACALVEEEEEGVADKSLTLRASPGKVGARRAREAFGLDDLQRPRVYAGADLAPEPGTKPNAPDGVVLDRGRNLAWQRAGSDYPLTLDEARDYLDGLDAAAFGGHTGWRLPTVDELCSLLRPRRPGDFCLESLFAPDQARLWSADKKSWVAHWYVNADLGFVGWQDDTCACWVRAICTL